MAAINSLPELIQTAFFTITSGSEKLNINVGMDEILVLLGICGFAYGDAGSSSLGRFYLSLDEMSSGDLVEMETGIGKERKMVYTTGLYIYREGAEGKVQLSQQFSYDFPYPIPTTRPPWVSCRFSVQTGRFAGLVYYAKLKATRELLSKMEVKYR